MRVQSYDDTVWARIDRIKEKIEGLYWYCDYHGLDSAGQSCGCRETTHELRYKRIEQMLSRVEKILDSHPKWRMYHAEGQVRGVYSSKDLIEKRMAESNQKLRVATASEALDKSSLEEIIRRVRNLVELKSPSARRCRDEILGLEPFIQDPDLGELIGFLFDQLGMFTEEDEKRSNDRRFEDDPTVASWLNEVEKRADERRTQVSLEKLGIALDSMKFDFWYEDWLRRCIVKLRETGVVGNVVHELIFELFDFLEDSFELNTNSCMWCGAKEIGKDHHLICVTRKNLSP